MKLSLFSFYFDHTSVSLTFSLLLFQSEKNVRIADIKLREPLFVRPDIGLLEMLGIFQEGQCHMAVVTADPACAAEHLRSGHVPPAHACIQGIVTLEDVLEKVIRGDITDETDTFGLEVAGGGGGASRKGVVTTTLVRTINRAHTVGDLLGSGGVGRDSLGLGSAGDDTLLGRRRSRSRSSRKSITELSSINVIAGDVRHKERPDWDSFSPDAVGGAQCSTGTRSGGFGGTFSFPNSPSSKGLDCLDDIVDTVIVDCELDLNEGEGDGDDKDSPGQLGDGTAGPQMSTLLENPVEDFVQVEANETTHLLAPKSTTAGSSSLLVGSQKAVR